MNAKTKQMERRLRRLAAEPFGEWERRDFGAGIAAAVLGLSPTPEVQDITHGFTNNRYGVLVSKVETGWGRIEHLWIRRHDGAPVRSWPDLQRIKDELVSPGRTAIEVFPPSGQVVDSANMLHLWVLPAGFELPFSLHRQPSPECQSEDAS